MSCFFSSSLLNLSLFGELALLCCYATNREKALWVVDDQQLEFTVSSRNVFDSPTL